MFDDRQYLENQFETMKMVQVTLQQLMTLSAGGLALFSLLLLNPHLFRLSKSLVYLSFFHGLYLFPQQLMLINSTRIFFFR